VTDRFGSSTAFAGLAAIAAIGLTAAYLLMPETRTFEEEETNRKQKAK
jgi:hypothetical protein